MNLNALAEQDLAVTLEDAVDGFAREFRLTDPNGTEYALTGIVNDTGLTFDTVGNAISGRMISISYRLSKLADADGAYIRPGRGWQARIVSDESGREYTAYVTDFRPDRRLGVGLLILSLEFGDGGD